MSFISILLDYSPMLVHRSPIREIRNEYRNTADRLAAFHEHRVESVTFCRDAEDTDSDFPRVVVHFAPEHAFSRDSIRFSVEELVEREASLRPYNEDIGNYGVVRPNCIETTETPSFDYEDGAERLQLFENLVFELSTTRVTNQSNAGRIFAIDSFVEQLEQNLMTIFGLLATRSEDRRVLATATYSRFNDVGTTASRRAITDDNILTRVVSIDTPSQDDDTCERYIEELAELLQPVRQSIGLREWEIEYSDALEIPDLTREE